MAKYVYFFGGKTAEGDGKMKELLGGKGANLAEMCRIGLPVPAGFTLTTEVCNYYTDHGKSYPDGIKDQVEAALKKTEEVMGARFGDPKNPLLVSCRSGARVSMPGMMDTVLNIGFNKAVKDRTGKDFPEDARDQMWGAIGAVFGSWMNDRAIVYRRQYGFPHEWGTAANICSMVFGNMGDDSGTGVAFTRDPATGEKVFYGEYLINAQGEDV